MYVIQNVPLSRARSRMYCIGTNTRARATPMRRIILSRTSWHMALRRSERLRAQRLRAERDDPSLARFVVEERATGETLGNGSYGSVEEVLRLI